MKVMKNSLICILLIIAAFMQNASALPGNAYVDDNGKTWEGYKTYTQNSFNVVLEWAVYKMASNPWAATVDFPDEDKFVYAYQLFNNSGKDVGSLGIRDKEGNPILETLMHATQSLAAGDGIMSDPNPSSVQGEWKWKAGTGFVTAGKYSAYLLFSSLYAPVSGSFVVRSSEESDPGEPDRTTPEPGSLALLTMASAMFAAKRAKNARRVK